MIDNNRSTNTWETSWLKVSNAVHILHAVKGDAAKLILIDPISDTKDYITSGNSSVKSRMISRNLYNDPRAYFCNLLLCSSCYRSHCIVMIVMTSPAEKMKYFLFKNYFLILLS